MEKMITKIAIFDLDTTLIASPLPEAGKKAYKEKTKNDWPHSGWWSKKESLDLSVFDIETFEGVIKEYHRCVSEENTLVIMMTGRLEKLSEPVNLILDKFNLHFDMKIFNKGGTTLEGKFNSIDDLLSKFSDVKQIEIFEDRPEHAVSFMGLSSKYKHIDITVHLVNQKYKLENEDNI